MTTLAKTSLWAGLLLFICWPGAALADRLALVIGINEYESIPPLSKAVGDAEAMSDKLTQLGFTVTKVLNPDRREFNQAITAFRRALRPGDAALVHYSGHGVEVDGRNLLLPQDIPMPTMGEEDFLAAEAIDLSTLVGRVADSGAAVRIFVIDACRDNPFGATDARGLGRLDGLALVAPPRGSFVLYSAGYRQTALDRLGPGDTSPTSVYTRVLLEQLDAPGASISEIARAVRVDVAALAQTVGHEQSPAYYDELTVDFVLRPGERPAVVPVADSGGREAAAFDRARDLGSAGAWNAFLTNYPVGVFADLARAALADLKPGGSAAAGPDVAAPAVGASSAVDAVIDDYAARAKLEALWDQGRDFAGAGQDSDYFRTMSAALDFASVRFGTDSEEYAQSSNHMVGAWSGMRRLPEAIAAAREAIRVYSALFGETDIRVLNDQANLAARLNAIGKTGEAEKLYRSVLSTYEAKQLSGWDQVLYAHALEGYAQVKASTGDLAAAERHARQALDVLEAAGLPASIDHGWIAANYGDILLKAGNCTEARAAFKKAANSMKAARIAEGQRDYADILRRLDRGC